ncbi:MAG: hypothetical protein EP321_08440 [Sphingomonadales bacterium]|nr:MAG: hypothetical protein EP345_08785 [Sphingomonadales bacterium]TNF04024.1 MAG: hypothetical protein EP321_08440 [Sphingomonadales bacterium]
MTSETTALAREPVLPTLPDLVEAIPAEQALRSAWHNWTFWFGPLVSLAILAATLIAIGHFDTEPVLAMLPSSPLFWALFLFSYMLTPLSEFAIFRRLWALPVEGIAALMRKRVSNELLLGYLGEVYFYSWARQHGSVTNAPFGAIKDVAILSALAGNIVTLFLIVPALPLLMQHDGVMDMRLMIWSIVIVGGTSALALLFRKRLFSLPASERRFVLRVHFARIIGGLGLSALLWHLVLPDVPVSWWFLLVTLRQLLSRLPLLPNKDVVFAGLAVLLIGPHVAISSLMALMAGLILALHLLSGVVFGCSDLLRRMRTA